MKNGAFIADACERVCPNNSIVQKRKPQVWYQGWNSNTRKTSSSGGAAAGLIEAFIHSGGYVAACLFKGGEFVFDITNDLDYAKNFAGSKYVKSNPVNIYSKVAKELKTGNKVLFVGLPCQVAAVKNYVKNTDNLYTIDLICHGSPSPQLLEKFLEENKVKHPHNREFEVQEIKQRLVWNLVIREFLLMHSKICIHSLF